MSVNVELLPAGKSSLGVLTLNAEKSLNSLTLEMIEEIYAQLQLWREDAKILGVLIKGQGRAFCAGGDIRALYDSMKERSQYAQKFFEKEYTLDCYLYSYPKPVLVWAHGICMGGGMGIMQGASMRVVTDSTKMAMPEITIGLIPDVGASHFLKRVPNSWGLFLALTGVRLKASEALQLCLADYWLKDEDLTALETEVNHFGANNPESFEIELKTYLETKTQKASGGDIFNHAAFVEKVLDQKTPIALFAWATQYTPQDEWEKTLIKNILNACPTSLGLIYSLWEKAKNWNVFESFYYEWIVASQCSEHGNFLEGVRALIVDKDNQPRWRPATPLDLSASHIGAHFVSPRGDGKNPLEFLLKGAKKSL